MPRNQNSSSLRALPSVDSLLRTETAQSLKSEIGAGRLSSLARKVTDELRREMLAGTPAVPGPNVADNGSRASLLMEAEKRLAAAHRDEAARGLRRVINATG